MWASNTEIFSRLQILTIAYFIIIIIAIIIKKISIDGMDK